MAGAVAMATAPAFAQAPLRLLSAGALEPGVARALALWAAQGGGPVEHAFNTAPRIAERLAAGERFDVLFATKSVIDGLEKDGRLLAPRMPLGSVGVGIALRAGAPVPALGDEAGLRAAVAAAGAVVFNRASTGLYMERLFARLGMAEAVKGKEVRFPDGDAVLKRIASGQGTEIAFAAITEILLFRDKGVQFAGPLPAALQNRTSYAAALLGTGEEARRFVAFMASGPVRAAMLEAGIE
jgi:molybdate transport system substrate-binding protein